MGRITLWGFYQYTDKKLFDDIKLYEEFDKQTLVDLILQQSGELFPFHQQPDFLKRNIDNWFARMYEQFKRMYDTLYSDYVPIENYDRMEAWSDSASTSESTSTSESESTSTSTSTSGSAHDITSDSNSNSLNNNVSAFDTSALSPDTAANGQTASRSIADTNNHTHTITDSSGTNIRQGTNDKIDYSFHEGRIHGNIGVMTTQAMIKEEIELRKFDVYETIANMFEEEFIIRRY